VAEPSL